LESQLKTLPVMVNNTGELLGSPSHVVVDHNVGRHLSSHPLFGDPHIEAALHARFLVATGAQALLLDFPRGRGHEHEHGCGVARLDLARPVNLDLEHNVVPWWGIEGRRPVQLPGAGELGPLDEAVRGNPGEELLSRDKYVGGLGFVRPSPPRRRRK